MSSTNGENEILCSTLEDSLILTQKLEANRNVVSSNANDSTVNNTVEENIDSLNNFCTTNDEKVNDESTVAEDSNSEYNDDPPSDCDIYEDASDYQEGWDNQYKIRGERTSSLSSLSNFDDSAESDWEEEKFQNPRTFGKIYKHPTKNDMAAFIPSDLHANIISKQTEIWHYVEDGQFDDADL